MTLGMIYNREHRHGNSFNSIIGPSCYYLLETVGGGRWPERPLGLAVSGLVKRVQVVRLMSIKMTP